jgi:hypothetical protein
VAEFDIHAGIDFAEVSPDTLVQLFSVVFRLTLR